MNIYNNITELVGKTPLVRLKNTELKYNSLGNIVAKVESFNPAGSVKDRIAYAMIQDAIDKGLLFKDSIIVEPTSGNTGIGLAAVAASFGFKIILTMPDTMSIERRNLLKAYGADLVLTDGTLGMKGAISKAEEILAKTENAFMPRQFENLANPEIHYNTTGPEIWQDSGENVDVFVSGIGTGGTISGVGRYLKEKNPQIKIIAVEPKDSPVLSLGTAGPHKIQGIGAGFVPDVLNTQIYDEIITVDNEDAFDVGREIAKNEGILVGISSGAALFAAIEISQREEFTGKNIVVLLPDTGERYLSSLMFNQS